jgi:hypothetical protein
MPVKYSTGPVLEGCEPLRVMINVCASALAAVDWAYAEASKESDMTVATTDFISVLSIQHEQSAAGAAAKLGCLNRR